ncbi:hypothetical protein Tco_1112708 [Tanacetum coccineum]|uniref:DUF4283 domain-containing protein n=1 Tax=Tanacetum coccineum TaxID=301880 RepID=A0ABQ5IQ24_9ASTR
MCMCLKDHLDAQECKQDKSTLETHVDFEEKIFDVEVPSNEAIPLSGWKKIAWMLLSSEGFLCVEYGTRFFSQKGSGGGRGVKEKQQVSGNDATNDIVNVVSSAVDELVLGRQCLTPIKSTAALNEGLTSYAKLITGEPSRKSVYFLTLLASTGNEADVATSLESVQAVSERCANTVYDFFLGKRVAYPFSSKDVMDEMLENGSWSSYARAMIEFRADVELKDTIMVAMPKLIGERFYMCTIRIEYDCKPPRCSSCKVFGHVLDECPEKIISNVVKSLKNPRQAIRGVQVSPNVGFKPIKQVYKPVSNKNSASSRGKKKQVELSRQEASNLNPFDALNLVENDDDLDTNVGIQSQIGRGQFMAWFRLITGLYMWHLVDSTVNADSDSEVEEMFNKTASFMASTSLKVAMKMDMVLRACWNNEGKQNWMMIT